jgi:hypothetical protein
MPYVDELIAVLLEARRLVALPGNDFSWSSLLDQEFATEELDAPSSASAPATHGQVASPLCSSRQEPSRRSA